MRCAVDIAPRAVGALRVLNVPDQPHVGPPPATCPGAPFHFSSASAWPWVPLIRILTPGLASQAELRPASSLWAYLAIPGLALVTATGPDPDLRSQLRLGLAFPPWTHVATWTLGWPSLPFSGQPCFSRCGAEPHLSRSLPWYHIWFTTSWRAAGSFCSPTQQCDRLSRSCVLLCLITVHAIGYWALQRTKLKLRYWLCEPPGPGEKNTDVK